MAITTYGELKTAIGNWLSRSDLTNRIPEFVVLAEAMIARDLRIREVEKRVTASITTQYFDIPTNFIEMRNFQINTDPVQHLNYVSLEQMDLFRPEATTGKPKVYTIHGSEFEVKPVPDQSYTFEMTYFYRLTAFSADSDTNTVLTRYPGVYLYASLVAAEPYLNNDADTKTWVDLYRAEIDRLNDKDSTGRFSGTHLYAKPRNIPE